jgi:hypothetical protein
MLMRRTGQCALGIVLLAALGCKSRPELSKTNDKGSSEWKHSGADSTVSQYSIASGNRIDTPDGEKIPELGIVCLSDYHTIEVRVGTASEPQTGAVSVGFDGELSQKDWEIKSNHVKDRILFTLRPPDADQAQILRQLRQSKDFQFEFTPKGGQPQRMKFKLLNINALLNQDEGCRKAGLSAQ